MLRRPTFILALTTAAVACAPATVSQRVSPAPLRTTGGMVVASSAIASEVGRRVLEEGGNAVDAAIATGFAMAVTLPSAGNIGGGGFMVVRFPDGRSTVVEFREKAPLAAHPNMFLDADGEYSSDIHHDSHLAVGVPGTVAGFALAHERYGTREWSALVDPAVRLAADGFALSPGLARGLAWVVNNTPQYPATVAALSNGGVPYEAGDTWRQPDLARSLERIRDHGRDGFYAGETARLVAEEMVRGGGWITEDDLARYEAKERQPITGSYRGYDIISMPPPSSGGVVLVEMLNILEGFDLAAMGHNSPEFIHHVTESMRLAYRDRAAFLADADKVEVPVERLTSKAYARGLRQSIDGARAGLSSPDDVALPAESEETTHYSVVDADGMAVSVTYTLEAGYGSRIVVPGAGFLLNNEMGDFNPRPGLTTATGHIGTEPNLARPEQRMLSSMTPTILAKDGELFAVLGSPGGRTIIGTVLEVVLGLVDFGLDAQAAVDATRFTHQWLPDRITIEEIGITPWTVRELEAMGHAVRVRGAQGAANVIVIDPATGDRIGAPDYRSSDAGAAGHN